MSELVPRSPALPDDTDLLRAQLEARQDDLTAREADILRSRYGLDGHPPATLDDLAQRYGVTREWVQQIERAALAKLQEVAARSPSLPALRDPSPVHQAVRDQLIADIGQERIEKLLAVVDAKTFTAILHWLSSEDRSAKPTKHRYTEDITAFAWWLGEHYGTHPVALLDVLDYDTVTVWTVWARSQGMAVRSRRRILAAVSSLFGDAAPRGWARPNPVAFKTHAPKVGKSDNGRPAGATRVLPAEDVAKMRDAPRTPEEHLTFGLLYELGLRESEVVNLQAENIDRTVSPAMLKFERKRGQWRKRQIPPHLQTYLDAHLDGRAHGPILINPKTGEGRTRHQLIDLTRRLARRGGVPSPRNVTPHVLRAAAITDLLNAGEPLQQVQKWADHEHATTTQGYWNRANEVKQDAALTSILAARIAKLAADKLSHRTDTSR